MSTDPYQTARRHTTYTAVFSPKRVQAYHAGDRGSRTIRELFIAPPLDCVARRALRLPSRDESMGRSCPIVSIQASPPFDGRRAVEKTGRAVEPFVPTEEYTGETVMICAWEERPISAFGGGVAVARGPSV